MPERLQKILAAAGLASRRTCERWISEGRVAVDGTVVTELGTRADPFSQKITLDGRAVPRAPARKHYIALHKPKGVTTTLADAHAARTVASLVDLPGKPMLRHVGRLDVSSEGLLFLSDDGAFIHRLTHPRYHVSKTYLATVAGTPSEGALRRLAEGIELEDGLTAPAERVRLVKSFPGNNTSDIELSIHEGKKRQVRRMMEAVGHPVQRLVRTSIGSITLGGLPAGAWRHLTPAEVDRLMKLAASVKDLEQDAASTAASNPRKRNDSTSRGNISHGKPKRNHTNKQGDHQGRSAQRPRANHSR
jgi:pseudouridine synthase